MHLLYALDCNMEWARRVHILDTPTGGCIMHACFIRAIFPVLSAREAFPAHPPPIIRSHMHTSIICNAISNDYFLCVVRASCGHLLRTLPYGTHMHSELRCIERKTDQQPHQSRTYISSSILANAITTTIAICIYFTIIHTTASKLNVKLANEDITLQNV